ncbi:MAG: lamin tail domain-containing protein [Deltaproteobacteria bacterium]|nr:lamin tail domain-containing protein [Deltaproteobacteria bacterium]
MEMRLKGGGNAGSTCLPAESVFGPICALIQDDRVVLSSRDSEWWIGLRVENLAWTDRVDALHPVVLRPLAVDSEHNLLLHAMDAAGVSGQWHETIRTAAVQPHVVINELMANPAGPEPEQEWVELFNDGQSGVQLEGWILEDSGGETRLPECLLGPGQYALVTNEAYDPASWVDRPPSPEAVIVRVPKLGTGGLSNNGEPLRLRTKDGKTVSTVPSIPSPKQSTSIARISPDALDTIPGSFLNSADGGTPGAPNTL